MIVLSSVCSNCYTCIYYFVDFSAKLERSSLPSTALNTLASFCRRCLSGWFVSTSPLSSSRSNTHIIGWYPMAVTSRDLMSKFSPFDAENKSKSMSLTYVHSKVKVNFYSTSSLNRGTLINKSYITLQHTDKSPHWNPVSKWFIQYCSTDAGLQ